MKANELMLGDWVKIDDTPVRIISIDQSGLIDYVGANIGITDLHPNLFSEDTMFSTTCINNAYPIPLTDEILAKNGFIKNNGHRVFYVHINEYNGYALQLDADDSGWYFSNNRFICIDCVHELQHILRLCKKNKEVVL